MLRRVYALADPCVAHVSLLCSYALMPVTCDDDLQDKATRLCGAGAAMRVLVVVVVACVSDVLEMGLSVCCYA